MTYDLLFICGGAWSGKTDRAENHARNAEEVTWMGTAANIVPVINQKILLLKSQRPAHWQQLDQPFELTDALRKIAGSSSHGTLVIDSVSQWIANEIARQSSKFDEHQLLEVIHRDVIELIGVIQTLQKQRPLIVVSSDFGASLPPADSALRTLRQVTGQSNISLAKIATHCEFMMAGLVLSPNS